MLLKEGSTGEDVKKLQDKLGLVQDGQFGPKTTIKVKEWQLANRLTVDGIVGDNTWNKLFLTNIPKLEFNLEKLNGHIPDLVIQQIPDTAKNFNITTKLRLAHFLSQCAHESANFTIIKENLNYSVDRMLEIFKSDFDKDGNKIISPSERQKAISIKGNPEKVANFVYANQNGNGNELSGDGWKFKGRGYIQLTTRNNYAEFDKFVDDDIVSNPDLVATKYPLASAGFFFETNNLWTICDKGSTPDVVKILTKHINGGYNGLPERQKYFDEYYNLLK